MSFIYKIIGYLTDISEFFYDLCLEVLELPWPIWTIWEFFYEISLLFNKLAWRFDDFAELLEEWKDEIRDILSWTNIRSLIRGWLDGIEDLIDWFSYWWDYVLSTVNTWWEAAQNTVKDWIEATKNYLIEWWETEVQELKDIVEATKAYLIEWWNTEVQELKDIATAVTHFFAVTLPTLASKLDVADLIRSALLEWFPFYDDLVSLWEDIKTFFTDPLQWAYDKLDEFFERFW